MTYENFIKEYTAKGLLKKQKRDLHAIEKFISRAYKELKIAKANLAIDEGVAFTVAYIRVELTQ